MRWRRAIAATLAGVGITVTVVRVCLRPIVDVLQEAPANMLPAGLPPSAYALVVDSTIAVVLALPGIVVAVLIAVRPSKPRPDHCRACGYDLTGNVPGRCPECGAVVRRDGRR